MDSMTLFMQQIVSESQNLFIQETRSCKGWIKLQEQKLILKPFLILINERM